MSNKVGLIIGAALVAVLAIGGYFLSQRDNPAVDHSLPSHDNNGVENSTDGDVAVDPFAARVRPARAANDVWGQRADALNSGECNMVKGYEPSDYDDAYCARVHPDKPSYLVIGDSLAADSYLVLKSAYPEVHFLQLTIPGCQLRLPNQFKAEESASCKSLYEKGFNEISRLDGLNGVILSSNWERGRYYRVDDVVNLLADTGLSFYVVGQHIQFESSIPALLKSSADAASATARAQTMLKPMPMTINEEMRNRFAGKAIFIDFMAVQCPTDCDIVSDDFGSFYLNDGLLSAPGAKYLGQRLGRAQPGLFP